MGGLSDARDKLACLQRRELELLQEFFDVHKAVEKQKVVIDELIKASTVPCIDRLPNELLAQIFLLIKDERKSLASVSCRWRAVIMATPRIWSEIYLSQYRTLPGLLKLHLERSRQAPISLSLYCDQPELEVVLSHAHRIHTLEIFGDVAAILDKFANVTLPSLEFLLVNLQSVSADLLLPLYSRAPALKCLQLEDLKRLCSASGPTVGHLDNSPLPSTSRIIPAESLTNLSLMGNTKCWELQRDSVHFPVLESLTLRISDPMSFLEAIVAPKLEHFEFSKECVKNLICRPFKGPTSKFDNVRQVTLSPSYEGTVKRRALELAKEFCLVFHGVRHAIMHMKYLFPLVSPCRTVDHRYDNYRPIDNWARLECLEVQDFDFAQAETYYYFTNWFTRERNLGLHLKLLSEYTATNDHTSNTPSSGFYQRLQECCASVELNRIPVSSRMYFSTSAGLPLFSPPVFNAGLVGQTDLAALAQTCPTQTVDTLLARIRVL
ncbi:hypothetical protein EDD16DRAFT_1700615 [Pisolithus croceorrhizus]|nr:hypothetical protein EDD16DRAFT_1700615 [Pisolithus croceorrhizus]KAI6131301.1 hypothetical protein EV401DRAFT_413046 [Pisolithus croceorrhizus]KAI6161148.1 hypothetical protein EDD17DRAFT_1759525 [Pisolithus thermaeus]